MKLTGVFLIETGVVNRGDGIGNIATVKKITTAEGIKVYFSPQSYKRALWKNLQNNFGWSQPLVTREGGVVQRTGTIIDSEEFDFVVQWWLTQNTKETQSFMLTKVFP